MIVSVDTVIRAATVADDADVADLASLRWQRRVDEEGERGTSPDQFTADFGSWWSARAESHLAFLAFLAFAGARPVGMAWLAIIDRIPVPAVVRVVPPRRFRQRGRRARTPACGGLKC